MDYSVSNWIWTDNWEDIKKDYIDRPIIVYFRKNFEYATKIYISANCRYKLYINGIFVQEGPQKGTTESAYKDPADIGEYLRQDGEMNEALVKVLYYPQTQGKRNDSLYYSQYPCLYVEDVTLGKPGERAGDLDGKYGWQYQVAEHIDIVGEPFDPSPIHAMEHTKAILEERKWSEAKPYSFFEANRPIAPFLLEKRTIPAMHHEMKPFSAVVCVREPNTEQKREIFNEYTKFLAGEKPMYIPPNTTSVVEITAGEEECGYPILKMMGGANARIHLLYSECYGIPQPDEVTPMGSRPVPPLKRDRGDYVNGVLQGAKDQYEVCGTGTEKSPEEYEPFWFRTFRYIQIKIETFEEGLTLIDFSYRSTGYPLQVKNHPISDNEEYNQIWDMSLRTLKRCMHETYVDCPFYEQLQYTMDTRAEILFTYEVSGDDCLARQAMEAFGKTQRFDGILQASAPATSVNIIPGFSIFYILMVSDHIRYFADEKLAGQHIRTIENVLEFFHQHLGKNGLVKSVGGVLFQHKYWSFIDWCPEWNDTIGVPIAATMGNGEITMESLLYLYGLKKAVEIETFLGRMESAKNYSKQAMELTNAIRDYCMDDSGLLQDGPGLSMYSTHCQVWGVLTDVVSKELGKRNIEKTYRVKGIPQCSVSMSFYLMEAMHKLDILKEHDDVWDPWREMQKNNMTTCVENFTDQRSDCHAWGSIMLYALPRYYM